jgi:transposase-like protein
MPELYLTPEIQAGLCRAVRAGSPLSVAARACGLRPATVRHWVNRARDGAEPYA